MIIAATHATLSNILLSFGFVFPEIGILIRLVATQYFNRLRFFPSFRKKFQMQFRPEVSYYTEL
jgi:hypothetical protein